MIESQRRQNLGYAAGTTAALGLTAFLLGLCPGFLVSPGASWLPVLRVRLWVLLRISRFLEFIHDKSAQQQPVRFRVIFLPWTLSSSLCTTLCPQQFVIAPCQRASFTCKTDSFLWGHGPDTLACKARPSFDRCGTSLSVSLSLSLSLTRCGRCPNV